MSGWPILDVAIGLSFIYLLLSTICTSLTEGITTQLRSRPKYLERGIAALIGSTAAHDFFLHPTIATFMNEDGDSVPRRILRTLIGKHRITADKKPSYLPGDKAAAVIFAMLNQKDGDQPKYPDLEARVGAFLKESSGTGDQIKTLQIWYDQVMERVSGWYKRHAQMWIRVVAIVVVIVLNADSTRVANLLWTDPTLRQITVEQARGRLEQPAAAPAPVDYTDTDEALPEDQPEQVGHPGDSSSKHLGLDSQQWELIYQLMSWKQDKNDLAQQHQHAPSQASLTGSFEYLLTLFWFGLQRHWLGWLITIVAVSLGSPFWFEALNRLVNIRNAGAQPAKSNRATEERAEGRS